MTGLERMTITAKSIAIIGGGPVGLAAAAHALERGLEPIVLEAGPQVGHAVRQWSHVPMFSPWEYNVDRAAARLLATAGWNSPPLAEYPTGGTLVDHYLTPLAERTPLSQRIRTDARVISVARVGFDKVKTQGRELAPFEVRYQNGAGPVSLRADAVIDASGTWLTPNPSGANGTQAAGEADSASRISYRMPDVLGRDRARYAGKTVAVLGAGHSAIGTLIDLSQLKELAPGTELVWLVRSGNPDKAFGGGANDKLAARGALGTAFARLISEGKIRVETNFSVSRISLIDDRLSVTSGSACCGRSVAVDELIVATGFRPDFDILRELRIALDPALECPPDLAPMIDPNEHSCGTVRPHGARELAQPESGLYIAGMKSYGRAPTFLLITGYEQVRSIVADIAGDRVAAERVELVLPETGVCSGPGPAQVSACCSAPAIPAS